MTTKKGELAGQNLKLESLRFEVEAIQNLAAEINDMLAAEPLTVNKIAKNLRNIKLRQSLAQNALANFRD